MNKPMVLLTGAALALAAPARADLITNGGFESGLSSWTVVNQLGSDGSFLLQTGPASPVNAFAVAPPPEGLTAAMTDAQGGGSHVMYQDFVVPANVTSASVTFSLLLNNQAEAYTLPAHLDWASTNGTGGLNLNQQARVDLMTAAGDVFSIGASVLQNLFQTTAATPLVTGYVPISVDLTAAFQSHAGETLRLRFAEVDNVNFFNLGVDDVRFTVVPEPSAWMLLAGGLGALVWIGTSRRA